MRMLLKFDNATPLFWVIAVSLMGASTAFAQAPTITALSPQAVKPGDSVDVTVRGGNLAGVTNLWTSFAGQAVLSPDVKDNGKNNALAVFRISVPANAQVGVHAVRVTTPQGVSALRLMCIDDLPSTAAAGNITTPSAAQVLTLPVAVDGVIGSLTRSYFKFHAAAGQQVSMEVLARRIGSALDPMIRVLDARGRELTYNDDAPGLSSDSQLRYTFKATGDYTVELRDIRYQGGGTYNYRLRLGDFPCVSVPNPMGAKRGTDVTLAFAGLHVDQVPAVKFKVPADAGIRSVTVGAKRAGGKSSGFATLLVGDNDEFSETEPNDTFDKASRATLGANLNGRLEKPGDVDHFVFTAKKGQKFTFTAVTRSQGSPTDLYLRMLNAKGTKVAEAEDSGINDAILNYTVPADGDYILAIEDLHKRGGSQFAYRVEVSPTQSGFSLAASADRLNIPSGGVAQITVTSIRRGYNGPIAIAVANLPKGVTSVPTIIGPGQKTVVLTVQSAADAQIGKSVPIRIVGTAKVGKTDFQAHATVTAALKTSLNGIPWPPELLSEAVALAVGPKQPVTLKIEPATVVFGRNLKATVKVTAVRDKGFDAAITLAVTPAKGGLPAGITAAVKPIPKGKNEIEIVFSATAKAPMGDFTAALLGTIKQGKQTVTQPAPGLGLALKAPLTLKAELAAAKVAKGGQLRVKASVERNPALKGAVVITFQNLPKGITAAAATIPADKNEVEILLSAGQNAGTATVKNLTLKGEVTVGKTKFSATSAAMTLTVE